MGVIEFKDVGKIFGPRETGFHALQNIDLEIRDKEFVASADVAKTNVQPGLLPLHISLMPDVVFLI